MPENMSLYDSFMLVKDVAHLNLVTFKTQNKI